MIRMDLAAGLKRQGGRTHIAGYSPASFRAGSLQDEEEEIVLMGMTRSPKPTTVGPLGQDESTDVTALDGSAVKRTGW